MNSIVEIVSVYAQQKRENIAVIASEEKITYAQLWNEVQGIASYLKSIGVRCGDRVLSKSQHEIWFVVACLGIQLAGAVHVPLEKSLGEKGISDIAEQLGASVVISDIGQECDDFKWINSADVRDLAKSNYIPNIIWDFPNEKDYCDIMFTTGTTGKSKGVIKSHHAVVSVADSTLEAERLEEDNVYLIAVPVNHISGMRKIYATLYTGTTMVLLDGFANLKKFYQYIADYNVTALYLPPSAIRILLLLSEKKLALLNEQLRIISTGAEAFPESDKERLTALLPDVRLYFIYGSSETGRLTQLEYSKDKGLCNCIGKPTKNVEIFIVDDNRKRIESSKDNMGFIAIKCDSVMNGYYNEPELTASVLSDDGIVYTDDVGYIDENGFIFMVGRKSHVINIGGLKIAPTEVESVALRYPGIAECACFAVADRMGGSIPKLNIVLNTNSIDITDLRNFMLKYLEAFKVPKTIEVVKEIPKTSNGKINRKELK